MHTAGTRTVLARPTPGFRTSTVVAETAGTIADWLIDAGFEFFFLPAQPQHRRTIVLLDHERAAVTAGIARDLADAGLYFGTPKGESVAQVRELQYLPEWSGATVRIFDYRVSVRGDGLSGPELGCDLQFWHVHTLADGPEARSGEPLVPGTLIGPRTSAPVPNVVPPDQRTLCPTNVDGRARPQLAVLSSTSLLDTPPPIDVVYTWVDDSDPEWRARREAALSGASSGGLHPAASHGSRYRSREELRYSLRSLQTFADWVRHVYIVTAEQVPPWLDTKNPRVTVIGHRDLFEGRGALPTFNSHAIETQLHHIQGLAENYLYLNDDVFFGRPVLPNRFVTANGIAKFFPSTLRLPPGPRLPSDRPFTCVGKNGRDLIDRRFGRMLPHRFQHTPHSLRRSVIFDLERDFADAVERTAAAQFRSDSDVSVSASVGHWYGFCTGRALPAKIAYAYFDIGRADTADRLELLAQRRDLETFCLNDNDQGELPAPRVDEMVSGFLERYFPDPSDFERH